jgi:hypothetical protein
MELSQKVQLIIISFIIASIITGELTTTISAIKTNPIQTVTVSENAKYTYLDIAVNPGTGTTFQRLVGAVNSPYVKIYENISLDNKTWISIPNLNFVSCNKSTDIQNFTDITYINLNQLTTPQIRIYIQYLIPPNQTLGISMGTANKSISTCMIFKSELTSNDISLRLLLFITIFISILNFVDFIDKKKSKHSP